jgi:hypothetical protein
MRIGFQLRRGQVLLILALFFAVSCGRQNEDVRLEPPPTDPLLREFIGYGVINISFVHIAGEPRENSVSQGYLRKGSLVKIIERRSVNNRRNVELWLSIFASGQASPDGGFSGWIRESDVDIYDNESRARTASEAMIP